HVRAYISPPLSRRLSSSVCPDTTLFRSSVDHDFEFAHFADGEVDAFAPQATRLDAAEGYVLGAEIGAFVDHHATHPQGARQTPEDQKSTRLNASHENISYDVFCLKK